MTRTISIDDASRTETGGIIATITIGDSRHILRSEKNTSSEIFELDATLSLISHSYPGAVRKVIETLFDIMSGVRISFPVVIDEEGRVIS